MGQSAVGQDSKVISGAGTYPQGETIIILNLEASVAAQVDPTTGQVIVHDITGNAQVSSGELSIVMAAVSAAVSDVSDEVISNGTFNLRAGLLS